VGTKEWNYLFSCRSQENSKVVGEGKKKISNRGKYNNLIYSKYKSNEQNYILIHLSFYPEPGSSFLILSLLAPIEFVNSKTIPFQFSGVYF